MEPDHNGTLAVFVEALRPYVKVLAVFILGIEIVRNIEFVMRYRSVDFGSHISELDRGLDIMIPEIKTDKTAKIS